VVPTGNGDSLSDTTAPPHPGCTAGLKAALTGRHDASFAWRCDFEVEDQWAREPSVSPGLFLSHGFPAEVLVHCGVPHLVREPDTNEELLRKQRIVRLG
jgi:hypothetical protein